MLHEQNVTKKAELLGHVSSPKDTKLERCAKILLVGAMGKDTFRSQNIGNGNIILDPNTDMLKFIVDMVKNPSKYKGREEYQNEITELNNYIINTLGMDPNISQKTLRKDIVTVLEVQKMKDKAGGRLDKDTNKKVLTDIKKALKERIVRHM